MANVYSYSIIIGRNFPKKQEKECFLL